MHPRVLGLWRALYEIDPWDENRADLRNAELCSVTANAAGAKKLDGDHFTPQDFISFVKAQMDPEELARIEIERSEAALMAYLDNVSGHKATKHLE